MAKYIPSLVYGLSSSTNNHIPYSSVGADITYSPEFFTDFCLYTISFFQETG